jgi:hypothetical protein
VKKRVLGGKSAVNQALTACPDSYGRGMRTNDDIWLPEHDAWGVDRLAWEDEQDDSPGEPDEPESVPEDPRY